VLAHVEHEVVPTLLNEVDVPVHVPRSYSVSTPAARHRTTTVLWAWGIDGRLRCCGRTYYPSMERHLPYRYFHLGVHQSVMNWWSAYNWACQRIQGHPRCATIGGRSHLSCIVPRCWGNYAEVHGPSLRRGCIAMDHILQQHINREGATWWRRWCLLIDKTCIHLRSTSVRTYTFFTTRIP
jgi:hypothetical protein